MVQVCGTPFDPPSFNPAKLSVAYEPGCAQLAPPPLGARRYTLTHNDLTGALQLSIGRHFNRPQLSGVCQRQSCEMMRSIHMALLTRNVRSLCGKCRPRRVLQSLRLIFWVQNIRCCRISQPGAVQHRGRTRE